MGRFLSIWHIILYVSFLDCTNSSVLPIVFLPPFLRTNSVNTVIVTPVNRKYENVDVHLSVIGIEDGKEFVIHNEKLKAKSTGTPCSVSFHLDKLIDKAKIVIETQGHDKIETDILTESNMAILHIHTDKPMYSPGETVSVRALPLTHEGAVYDGVIEFTLVNPNGFELVRKYKNASDGFIEMMFELPKHLFYGKWQVIAQPKIKSREQLIFSAKFEVKDHVLPSFKIFASIPYAQSPNATKVTVEARNYFGSPVSGSLELSCTGKRTHSSSKKARLLFQSQMSDGFWQRHIDISMCFLDGYHQAITILVRIFDSGTGARGEAYVDFDPLAPGFEFIPLRPAFSDRTKHLLFMTQSLLAPNGSEIEVRLECLGSNKQSSILKKTVIGDVLSVSMPMGWQLCHVVMVEASRQVGLLKSRKKTLMLPKVTGAKSFEPSWIELSPLKNSYFVGEHLQATVPKNISGSLNYLIICNSYAMTASGVLNGGSITVTITRAMIGQCTFFVYTTSKRRTTDTVQFDVVENCQVSLHPSSNIVKPGTSVTFTIHGHPHGIALVRAIDDRVNSLMTRRYTVKSRFWEFCVLNQSGFGNVDNGAKLINFIDYSDVRRLIEERCASAANAYFKLFGLCPNSTRSLTEVSNFCLDIMVLECFAPLQPTVAVSTVCDMKNPRECDLSLKKAKPFADDSLLNRFHSSANNSFAHSQSDTVVLIEETESDVRQNFPEVWLFDAISLGASGEAEMTAKTPDTIGTWSVSSMFWSPGQRDLCNSRQIEITSTKEVFMKIDIPKFVYVNETISAKVSVTTLNSSKEVKYTVCLSEMSRKMCADLGSFGQLGKPGYSRVITSPSQPTDTKTFALRFLDIGTTSVTFIVRDETTFPGKHHCSIGEVRDIVKHNIEVSKRDETEELYKVVILDADKSSLPSRRFAADSSMAPVDVFSVEERRLSSSSDILVTDVHVNVPNSDAIYSFSTDISNFLATNTMSRTTNGIRRTFEYEYSFLSDVLKELSVELYQLKRINQEENSDRHLVDASENRIGALISGMLRFSDCRSEMSCGYAEYRSPRSFKERSIALTAIATSLLCEAAANTRLVCGGLSFLLQALLMNWNDVDVSLDELIHLDHALDREWFLKAFLLQVSHDCAAYECVKNDEAWLNLILSLYSIDEEWKWDIRTIAALAFMGTNATSEIMRIRMISMTNGRAIPFWNAGETIPMSRSKSSSFNDLGLARRQKSGDVLVNALGILAFISSGADGQNFDWDLLANWLYEQQSQDGSFENAIDTYFASRALFVYRSRKIHIDKNGNKLTVKVQCPLCETQTINVTQCAKEIYIPTQARNLTFETEGHGKAIVAIRVVARKRQRSRRGLGKDYPFPARITVDQQRVLKGTLRQTVCIRVLSEMIKTIEITHGLYTGYSAAPNSVAILSNSTSVSIVSPPTVSSFAVHFVLDGFRRNEVQCYEIGITEPSHSHEPFHLAPVAITLRHPLEDVVGLTLISHPDQDYRKRPTKRESKQILERSTNHVFLSRIKRGIVDDSIDTVCFQGGSCACAESSCGVKCGICKRDVFEELKTQISNEKNFGALLRVLSTERVLVGYSFYNHLTTEIREKQGGAKQKISDKLEVWLRDCNPRCTVDPPVMDDKFFIIGEADALALDSSGRQHYVLRDVDRFEKATIDCAVLSNVIILGS